MARRFTFYLGSAALALAMSSSRESLFLRMRSWTVKGSYFGMASTLATAVSFLGTKVTAFLLLELILGWKVQESSSSYSLLYFSVFLHVCLYFR